MTRRFFLLVAAGSLTPGPFLTLSANAGTWQQASIPFESAMVRALAVAPTQAARVYVGLRDLGVYRTDDRGTTWIAANGGLPAKDATPIALDVEAANADRAIVSLTGSRVFRTIDAGATWIEISPSVDGFFNAVRIDELDHSILYLGVSGGTEPGIHRSTDSGATWTYVSGSLGAVGVRSLTARPGDPNVIVAGHDSGAAKSTDRGVTWAPTGAPSSFTELAFSPADPNRVWGSTSSDEIHRSDDAGDSFSAVSPLPEPFGFGVSAIAPHPLDPDLLMAAGTGYGCDPFVSYRARVWRTTDAGTSWTTQQDAVCSGGGPTGLAFERSNPAHVYLGQNSNVGKGIDHSSDGGATWTTRVSGLHQFVVQAVRGDLGGVVYALREQHFYRYAPPPAGWVERGVGKGFWKHTPRSLEVNSGNGDLLHDAGTFADSDVIQDYADRSTDGGISWSPAFGYPPGLPTQVERLMSNHGDGTHVYAISFSGLSRSDDSHATYSLVNALVDHDAFLVIDPNDWQRLFCTHAEDHEVALSTDGGASFAPRDAGLPAPSPDLIALFMRKSAPDELVVIYEDGRVFETFDAGVSWSLRYDLGFDTFSYLARAAWDPASGHVFVAVRDERIYTRHPDYTEAGLPTTNLTSLWYSPGLSTLFAGTYSSGLWQQRLEPVVGAPVIAGDGEAVLRAAPNPFSTRTTISLSSPAGPAPVVEIANVAGRIVRRFELEGGNFDWDGTDVAGRRVPAGVYFVRAEAGGVSRSVKVVLIR